MGGWRLVAGKLTVGLASHWPRITDISGSPPTGSRPGRGRWAPAYALLWSTVDFTLPYFSCCHHTLLVSLYTMIMSVYVYLSNIIKITYLLTYLLRVDLEKECWATKLTKSVKVKNVQEEWWDWNSLYMKEQTNKQTYIHTYKKTYIHSHLFNCHLKTWLSSQFSFSACTQQTINQSINQAINQSIIIIIVC